MTNKELDQALDSARWAFRVYGNQNGFRDQNAYADKEVENIKVLIQSLFSSQRKDWIDKLKNKSPHRE